MTWKGSAAIVFMALGGAVKAEESVFSVEKRSSRLKL